MIDVLNWIVVHPIVSLVIGIFITVWVGFLSEGLRRR